MSISISISISIYTPLVSIVDLPLTEAHREIIIKHVKWSGRMCRLASIRDHIRDQVLAQRVTEKRRPNSFLASSLVKIVDACYKSTFLNILYAGQQGKQSHFTEYIHKKI